MSKNKAKSHPRTDPTPTSPLSVHNEGDGNVIGNNNRVGIYKPSPVVAQSDREIDLLLEQLSQQVQTISRRLSQEDAEHLRDAAAGVVKDVRSAKPQRKWWEVSVAGLKQAAINIGEVGQPVLEIVAKLLPILTRRYP